MDKLNDTADATRDPAPATRKRRSQVDRLRQEMAALEERLAQIRDKRQVLEQQLKRAEDKARLAARKAHTDTAFRIGNAYLRLLEHGSADAVALMRDLLKTIDEPHRRSAWVVLHAHAATPSQDTY